MYLCSWATGSFLNTVIAFKKETDAVRLPCRPYFIILLPCWNKSKISYSCCKSTKYILQQVTICNSFSPNCYV